MALNVGIIDLVRNPVAINSWVEQGYGFSSHRGSQLEKILGQSIREIKAANRHEGAYPAFVAIRWGYAEMVGGKLMATSKRVAFDQ